MAVRAAHTADDPAIETVDPTRAAPPSRHMADAIRALALDALEATQPARSQARPLALTLGMADVATSLWTRFLRFDADDPRWPDRDRFVAPQGHASILLHALLHLTGHAGTEIEALRSRAPLRAPVADDRALRWHPAIETAPGPPGQGLATAVGMALAERLLAARFGKSLVDHRTWAMACDADLMEGISHEAIGLAGAFRLAKLTLLYECSTADRSDDPLKRFAAHGWAVKHIDGHDGEQIAAALSWTVRSKKPTLIACRTATESINGPGVAPGQSMGRADAPRRVLGWKGPPFTIPERLAVGWRAAGVRGASARRAWLKRLARHPLRAEFARVMAGRLPATWHEIVARVRAEVAESRRPEPTRRSSRRVLETLAAEMPELVGGSAHLPGARPTSIRGMGAVGPGNYAGRSVGFGAREHGMAAAANGMALHGGLIPFDAASLASADHMRPALRLGALTQQRVIHVLTQEASGVGEAGPAAHELFEDLASLRAMAGVHVFRPADAVETAESWELAIRRDDGPSLLVLTRRALPLLRTDAAENRCARGGYVLAEADGGRRATLIATGSEVSLAMAAREALAADGIAVAVVSLPCWEIFGAQDESYRTGVLGLPGVPRFGFEAGCDFGWERWLGPDGIFMGVAGFGASACVGAFCAELHNDDAPRHEGPGDEFDQHFVTTLDAVAVLVKKRLS